MTKRTITEEQLKTALANIHTVDSIFFRAVVKAAFPPKSKAQHNQVIAVSDVEGDFSANIFRKFMHMRNERYQCLGNPHLNEGIGCHWAFARALTEEELGGVELDGSNLVPDVTADESDPESESPVAPLPYTVYFNQTLSQLSDRLNKLEHALSEKFATKEDLVKLISIISHFEDNDNPDNDNLLRNVDRKLLDNLKANIIR